MHFCIIVFFTNEFLKPFLRHFNFMSWWRNFILQYFICPVELNFADFRSQERNREIFMPRKFPALKQLLVWFMLRTTNWDESLNTLLGTTVSPKLFQHADYHEKKPYICQKILDKVFLKVTTGSI